MYLRIGNNNVTQLIEEVTTQGAKSNCARQLTASILQPHFDSAVPKVAVNIGDTVTFKSDGHEYFGIVFDVQRQSSSNTVEVTAFDMCIYAKKNKICFKAKNTTPESMARALFSRIGLPYGGFERTEFSFTHTFYDTSIYDAVMTAYGYAAVETGEKFIMRAEGTRICVLRRGAYVAAIINPKQNLIDATYKVSAQNAVNRVEVRDEDGNLLKVYKGDDTSYGICTEIIRKSETCNTEAKKQIDDGQVEKTATVTNLGNPYCVTGNAVIVKEPHTGMYGLFYIESDVHTWSKGIYQNKLTLNYRNIMDKESVYKAQSLSSSSGKSKSSDEDESEKNTETYTWKDPWGGIYEQ